jgi:hypothetical protein
MKDLNDVKNHLQNEITHWFNVQWHDTTKPYYLFYNVNRSGFLIVPSVVNNDYELAMSERLSVGWTKEQAFSRCLEVLKRLPVLEA